MIKDSQFKSPWWLKGPHLQTIWSSLLRKPQNLNLRRERLSIGDDFIDLDWADGNDSTPITIILHGLTGSSDSNYAIGLQSTLSKMGWRSVVMNFRGCSGEPNHSAKTYHSGETSDFNFVYRVLMEREPNTPHFAVGFSLGGNVLLKWLGESTHRSELSGAVAISAPFLLSPSADKMDQGLGSLYRKRFLKKLTTSLSEKKWLLKKLGKIDEYRKLERIGNLSAIKSFWEFDEYVTARLFNFNSAGDYYQQASCRPYLKRIHTPTLILHAKNDPLVCRNAIPNEKHLSPAVSMEISNSGGHVGFVTGNNPFKPIYWLEERIPTFLTQQLKIGEQTVMQMPRKNNTQQKKTHIA